MKNVSGKQHIITGKKTITHKLACSVRTQVIFNQTLESRDFSHSLSHQMLIAFIVAAEFCALCMCSNGKFEHVIRALK